MNDECPNPLSVDQVGLAETELKDSPAALFCVIEWRPQGVPRYQTRPTFHHVLLPAQLSVPSFRCTQCKGWGLIHPATQHIDRTPSFAPRATSVTRITTNRNAEYDIDLVWAPASSPLPPYRQYLLRYALIYFRCSAIYSSLIGPKVILPTFLTYTIWRYIISLAPEYSFKF
jgi:hypothetical protein